MHAEVGSVQNQRSSSDVEQFLLTQTRDQCAPRTRNVYLASVRWLLGAAGRREITASIPQARTSRALGTVLSGSDVQRLLAAITFIKYRAVLTTAYGAGLRIGEVLALDPFGFRNLSWQKSGRSQTSIHYVFPRREAPCHRAVWRS
jgi:integrase/recombinase XerD